MERNKIYVKNLLKNGKRMDNRALDEYRKVTVEKSVVGTAEGSARVKIGKTEVIAGVKMGIMKPYPDTPNEGSLIIDVEFVPLANPEFESGRPGETAIELARVIDRGIRESKTIDVEKLCVKEKEFVWKAHIDIHVLDDDGNLYDAAGLAAIAALQDTKILKFDEETEKVIHEHAGPLPLKDAPIPITVIKIGDSLIVDPNLDEFKSLDARLTVAITKKGDICAIQKGGSGYLTKAEVETAVDLATTKSKELRKLL